VTIKVLYFASLREQIGKSAEDLAWSGGTVEDLKKALQAKGGAYEKALSGKALVRAAVNQEMVQASAPVKAGDEVAFFPPVTGG
jgi:molybdopterin synthase sulfur carrier subunit